jgi:putative transposase
MIGLPRSTYYRRPSLERAEALGAADAALRTKIDAIAAEFPAYGYRRITHELRRRGTVANHKRVARVMRAAAMRARPRRRFVLTTDSAHPEPV